MGVNSVVAHAAGRMVGTDQVGLCHFQLPHCLGRLAVRLFSIPLPVSTNAMDRTREAGRPACPLLVVRLERNPRRELVLALALSAIDAFLEWLTHACAKRVSTRTGREALTLTRCSGADRRDLSERIVFDV